MGGRRLSGAKSKNDKWRRWRQAGSDLKAPVCQMMRCDWWMGTKDETGISNRVLPRRRAVGK